MAKAGPKNCIYACIANHSGHASGQKDQLHSGATKSPGLTRNSLLPFVCMMQVQTDLQYIGPSSHVKSIPVQRYINVSQFPTDQLGSIHMGSARAMAILPR